MILLLLSCSITWSEALLPLHANSTICKVLHMSLTGKHSCHHECVMLWTLLQRLVSQRLVVL